MEVKPRPILLRTDSINAARATRLLPSPSGAPTARRDYFVRAPPSGSGTTQPNPAQHVHPVLGKRPFFRVFLSRDATIREFGTTARGTEARRRSWHQMSRVVSGPTPLPHTHTPRFCRCQLESPVSARRALLLTPNWTLLSSSKARELWDRATGPV